ncbi:bacterio-opsin activator domain-containing protein [Halohasta salina]|uniref:bacterio-opsin activator domain-containing protein n=1 Tax=Halohasta salina TaxID=2961621 RepID=UPI0020A39693|nr:bacterio-opsin activator domain-containing protein [Halohasta salina]
MSSDSPAIKVLFAGEALPEGPTAADLAADDRFVVSRSRDFLDARDHATDTPVDCVVATHCEAGFDGVAFLEAVRSVDADLPVVVLASSVDAELTRRLVAADASAFVVAAAADAHEAVVEAIEAHVDAARKRSDRLPISDLSVEAERRLKERALDEAPIGITIADATAPDIPSIYMNAAFEDVTGYPPAEAVGVNHRFLQGPETDHEQSAELAAGIDAERDTEVVLRNYRRDGTPFWNQVRVSPIYDDDGEVSHYVGFQMDVTDRERAQRELRAERESLNRLLDRVEGLLNDVTDLLVRGESRTETERLLVERAAETYLAAWLGRYDAADERLTVSQQAGDRVVDADPIALDADDPALEPLQEAVADTEPQVVTEDDRLHDLAADEVCVLVPLAYRSTTYGVLGIVAHADSFDDRERVLLGSLGRSVGTSINYTLTKRTITTDTVLTIGVELFDDDLFFVQLAAALDLQFDYETIVSNERDPGVLALVSTQCADADAVVDRAVEYDGVAAAEVIADTDDRAVLQFRLTDSPLVDVLAEFGSRLTELHADSNRLAVEFCVGTEEAAQSVLGALRETYDRVDLVAYHESDPQQTSSGFREELRSQLTDRQLTALKKAYVSGYFEWPRRVEGKQLAASMDIVPSTYHQHLQSAKRKLVAAFFDE